MGHKAVRASWFIVSDGMRRVLQRFEVFPCCMDVNRLCIVLAFCWKLEGSESEGDLVFYVVARHIFIIGFLF